MRIATFNVNGVNGRLPVLLRWLEQAKPDIVCLQELKAPQGNFPEAAIRDAGYRAVWHGQKSWNGVAILARGTTPVETRRGLPGDADDEQSRYIEAAVNGVLIACLYLPNGNPAPGPKSITNSDGSTGSRPMLPNSSPPRRPSCSPGTSTLCPLISTSISRSAGLMTRSSDRRCAMPFTVSSS